MERALRMLVLPALEVFEIIDDLNPIWKRKFNWLQKGGKDF
jgi:hypothetical protein